MLTRRVRAGSFLVAIGLLAAPGVAAAQAPIKVGSINSFSGLAAAFTVPERLGEELAAEQANAAGGVLGGRKIVLVARDDKLRPDEGIKQAQELVFQEKVDFLIGTLSSAVALGVSDFAKKNKTLYVAGEAQTDALTWERGHRHVFRVRPNTYMVGRALAERAAKLPHKRWVNIGPNYEYGRKTWEAFITRLKELKPDVQVVAEHWPKLGEGEYAAYVNSILQARPDAVFTSLFGADWANFVKQASAFEMFGKTFFVAMAGGLPEFAEPLGKDQPDGMIVDAYPWQLIDTPAHRAFVEAYRKKANTHPVYGSLIGYINMTALIEAIKKAGTTDTEKVIDALEGLTIGTPVGPVTFRADDHQSTLGAWIGVSKFDAARSLATIADWEYVPGEKHPPTRRWKDQWK
jgi:branched-chain amino acid transport system substrate-binding protein